MECPNCGKRKARKAARFAPEAKICSSCGAVYGSGYFSDLIRLVNWERLQANVTEPGTDTYFDFEVISGSKGVYRVHGWFDPATKCAVQYG